MTPKTIQTGIAEAILTRRKELPSLIKLHVPLTETNVCNVALNSVKVNYLKTLKVFIIDVASMIQRYALHATDKGLRDIIIRDLLCLAIDCICLEKISDKFFQFSSDFSSCCSKCLPKTI